MRFTRPVGGSSWPRPVPSPLRHSRRPVDRRVPRRVARLACSRGERTAVLCRAEADALGRDVHRERPSTTGQTVANGVVKTNIHTIVSVKRFVEWLFLVRRRLFMPLIGDPWRNFVTNCGSAFDVWIDRSARRRIPGWTEPGLFGHGRRRSPGRTA